MGFALNPLLSQKNLGESPLPASYLGRPSASVFAGPTSPTFTIIPEPKQDIIEHIVPSKGVEPQVGDSINNQIQQAKKGDESKKKRQEEVNIIIQQAKKGDVGKKKQKLQKKGINGKIQQQRLQQLRQKQQQQKQQQQKQKRQKQRKKRQQQKERQQQ